MFKSMKKKIAKLFVITCVLDDGDCYLFRLPFVGYGSYTNYPSKAQARAAFYKDFDLV